MSRSSTGASLGDADLESFFQQYEALKEDHDALVKRYADLMQSHTGTVHKLELSQEELNRVKGMYEEAYNAIKERNAYKQQCTSAIRQWDAALKELNEYKEALNKVQQQHEEAMKEINQGMAARFKANKEMKRLTEERDAALQEYSLIMSERDSVHRELEKLTDDLTSSKKQMKTLETVNKELQDKVAEATKEADVEKMKREWAFTERDKIVKERESLRALCDRLRKERDRAVSDLAEALSESEDIRKQKNLASKQLKELRDKIDFEKDSHHQETIRLPLQYFSNSSSFSESRDSAIDSDMPSGHYSIKLPNVRGADHGLVLEPGVYISRILPGSPAAKESNLNVGDRVLFINDSPIDNVQDAILALSEDIDPIILTLSRTVGHLSSPISANAANSARSRSQIHSNKASAHASNSSLRSDKSDPNSVGISDGRRQGQGQGGNGSKTGSGGLRDIFRVRLPRKKHSSPEEEILATLDSAIASGGTGGGSGSGGGTSRKKRNKRVSRNLGNDNNNKTGTWPRVMASRNSYTLPQEGGGNSGVASTTTMTGGGGDALSSTSAPNHRRDSSYYGHYMPVGSNMISNTVCVRRPQSGKDRARLSNMLWDLQQPQPSKSVGAIAFSGPSSLGSGGGGLLNNFGFSNNNAKSLTDHGRPLSGGLALEHHGLPIPSSQAHHRYSMGVFDPTPSSGKIGKGAPERNSVVPTLTMSDGSSIDFSVKSGNMEIIDYYLKRMAKNQNNSSESDHLDKVVTPPSMGLPNQVVSNKSQMRHSAGPTAVSTLDRYQNRYSSPYPAHYHELLGASGPLSSSNSGTIPLSLPKQQQQQFNSSNNNYAFDPSSLSQSHYAHHGGDNPSSVSMSGGTGGPRLNFRNSDDVLLQSSYHFEPPGTFPRKREPHRIRIPSNQSVTSKSSTERVDLRNSPMPRWCVEPEGPGSACRSIRIDQYDKSMELGIQIACKPNVEGVFEVFVSHVAENSLASQVGLQVGDQLLDVCGINMRNAPYELAAKVLRESGDPLTLKVQYSPDKYFHGRASSSEDLDGDSSSSADNDNDISTSDNDSHSGGSRSGSPTPCNSPQSTLVRNSKRTSSVQHKHPGLPSGTANSSLSKKSSGGGGYPSGNNSLTKSKQSQSQQQPQGGGLTPVQQQQIQQALVLAAQEKERSRDRDRGDRDPPSEQSTLRSTRSSGGGGASIVGDPNSDGPTKTMLLQDKTRFLTLQLMKNSSNLGICLVGGNLVGIFIHSVQPDSVADRAGLRTGDQILEYNGTDLRHATAEEAAFELAKPLDKVGILVQYNLQRYNEVKDQPGDGFYIRALFDYPALSGDPVEQQQLSFCKDDILYIDNTMYNGKPGRWRAWKVDGLDGHSRVWGVIPSKYKVEEEMLFKRSLGDLDGDRRSSTITRRSFFRRKSHHRSSSRELASFSDFSINSYGELSGQQGVGGMKDEGVQPLNSYQKVERWDCKDMNFLRPVVLVGALSDLIAERLVQDFPYLFAKVAPEYMRCDTQMLQKCLVENIFVDYKRKGSDYECITRAKIEEIRSKKQYGILDISTAGVERLQATRMYPIVIFVKFKSAKQIREIKDFPKRHSHFPRDKAKELYEHSLKVESEYKHLITTSIPRRDGGSNISYLALEVKTAVEKEQSKTLWVPA